MNRSDHFSLWHDHHGQNSSRPPLSKASTFDRYELSLHDLHSPQIVRAAESRFLPRAFAWSGSVVPATLTPAIICTVVAIIITYLYERTNVQLSMHPLLIPVLSFVVALLLTYRTNTAYDRYWEGRRLWSELSTCIRNLARFIWVNIGTNLTKDAREELKTLSEDQKIEREMKIQEEKEKIIKILLAFAIATKYYLRSEIPDRDVTELLASVKSRVNNCFETFKKQAEDEANRRENSNTDPNSYSRRQYLPSCKRTPSDLVPPVNNLPFELTLYINAYINSCMVQGFVDPPIATYLFDIVSRLTDCLGGLERIRHTPIPLAYAIHLDLTVWVFCLTLSVQLVSSLHWTTIPVVFITSLILIGMRKIGEEIEDPFGHDANDLNITGFCDDLKEDLEQLVASPFSVIQTKSRCTSTHLRGETLVDEPSQMEIIAT